MKKVLFIDRDGTLIEEPVDYQIDCLSKVKFKPGVFAGLKRIATQTDYELVMVTNQDGLGTASFPEETFWPAQQLLIDALKGEGIVFDDVLIDRSMPSDNADTRKPRTGMLKYYLKGGYDLTNSFVIGDRSSDAELAVNLGARAIMFAGDLGEGTVTNWEQVADTLIATGRRTIVNRDTNETKIAIALNLDGSGQANISTGLGFFDHMLEQISKHGDVDLDLKVSGDLEVDEHHTIEDVGLALGQAFRQALGTKKGMERYAFVLPMDDCLAQVAIDFGGRSACVWSVDFTREMIGDVPTEMFQHFFESFCDQANCNLNIKAEGDNNHHKIEAVFKAVARAMKCAVKQNENGRIPSTKGIL